MESTGPASTPLSSSVKSPIQSEKKDDPKELEQVIKLRETYAYFKQIQDEMSLDMEDEEKTNATPTRKATAVWGNLKSIRSIGGFVNTTSASQKKRTPGFGGSVMQMLKDPKRKAKYTPFGTPSETPVNEVSEIEEAEETKEIEKAPSPVPIEEEDHILDDYWSSLQLQLPEAAPLEEFTPPDAPTYEEEYAQESKENKVVLGKISKEKVREQKDVLKTKLYEERTKTTESIKIKERDLLWREHLALERVKEMEDDCREKMANERIKLAKIRVDREKRMAREFRRARESLEFSVQRQNAVLGEVFGELDTHSQAAMARKMYVKSTQLPQPVEFRVHMLRAVKNKLPKGAYTLMLTQYDTLGGHALNWSTIGSHSIGPDFPATTRAVKHAGRYFDKQIKFEDSCFALCPAKKDCKPSFVFVFELFELRSRTNSHDKVVAWTAMPMVTDGGAIAQGKMKLPLMRGRHTPNDSLFKNMEKSIAADLDTWLCNLYVEIRAFSISELGSQAHDVMKLNRFVNFDYLNKWLDLQNGLGEYSKTYGSAARHTYREEKRMRIELDASNPGGDDGDGATGATGAGAGADGENAITDDEGELGEVDVELDHGLLRLSEVQRNNLKTKRFSRKESKFSSKGVMYSAARDEEEQRSRLSDNSMRLSGNSRSLKGFDDGFGAFSLKVKQSQEETKSLLWWMWQQCEKVYVEKVLGEEYYPSRSNPGRRSRASPSSRRQVLASRKKRDPDYSRRVRQALLSNKGKFDGGDSSPIVDVRGAADMPVKSTVRAKPVSLHSGESSLDLRDQLFGDEALDDVDLYTSSEKTKGDLSPSGYSDAGDEEAGGMSASSKKYYGEGSGGSGSSPGQQQQQQPQLEAAGLPTLPQLKGILDDLDSDGFSMSEDEGEGGTAMVSSSSKKRVATVSNDPVLEVEVVDPRQKVREEIHQKKLAQKAKEAEDELVSIEVLERGLESGAIQGAGGGISVAHDLDYEQSGKLVGIESVNGRKDRYFASSGLNKRVIRRLQADGPRIDSEGIPGHPADEDDREKKDGDGADAVGEGKDKDQDNDDLAWLKKLQPSRSLDGPSIKWAALEDPRDFELYNMSLQAQSAAQRLTAGGVVSSKMRLLIHAVLGDITMHKWGSFEFYITMFCIVFSLWLRIWLHYLGEYIYLSALGVPIFDFVYMALQIQFKYMSVGLTFGSEVCVIFMGPLFVTLVFCVFAEMERLFHSWAGAAPEGLSKFVSCFGLNMFLGPYVTVVIDLCYRNFDCSNQSSACRADYTSTSCDCFNGDFVKLWERSRVDEGSGISGFLITVIVYIAFSALSAFFYYEYLVYLHRDGKVLDLWRRISASEAEFFLPDDFEISLAELKYICSRAGAWTGGDGSKRKLSVSVHEERDPDDETFLLETKLFTIHEISFDGLKRKIWRQFLAEPDGTITEVYDKVGVGEKEVAVPSPDFNFTHPTAVKRTRTGIFKGLERA